MLAESEDNEQTIPRVAALDIGKAELVCCVRVPAPRGRRKRLQEVSTHSTMTTSLTELANHLVELGVQRVVMERQMLRPSFVPPLPIRRLRDLTRYRVDLVAARTAEKSRVEKLLEDAGIKLSVVAADTFGVSGRAMMAAMIAGERDPKVLAQLARSRMRTKIGRLEEA